jgi:hypothetical protein
LSYEGVEQARGPEDVMKIANFLKQNFPDPVFAGMIDQTLADMPSDPTLFPAWKEQTKRETLTNAQQLEQDFTQQNLGTSTRIVSTPKFGGGAATVVPGSEAEIKMKPVITTIDGNSYFIDPETNIAYPAAVGNVGGAPAGGRGVVGGARGNSADVVYGFGQFAQPPKPISSMTIGEVQNFQKNELIPATRGKIGAGPDKGTGAVGTYQIVYGTLKDYAPKVLGPNWRNTPFTADVQDRIAKAIYEDVKDRNLKDTWAGLPANRPGAYSNVPWEQVRDQIAAVESGGGRGAAPAGGGAPKTISQAETERGFKKTLDLFGYNPKTGEDTITPLIKASTSGGLERIGSDIAGFATGKATPGRVAIGQLKALKDNMVFEKLRGKLGAQISDADVRLIASTMADIANPDIPANERALAWQNIVLPILIRGAGMEPPVKKPPPPPKGGGGKRKPPIESFGGR